MFAKIIFFLCGTLLVPSECHAVRKPPSVKYKTSISAEYCSNATSGYSCKDSQTSVYCALLPTGNWAWDVMRCNPEQTCSRANGQCTNSITTESYESVCYQTGFFPHAFDCRQYYLCIPNSDGSMKPEPMKFKCDDGYAYDPSTTRCRIVLENNSCPRLIEPCSVLGESGNVPGNPSMYYVCLPGISGNTLVPALLYCDADKIFIGTSCVTPNPPNGLDSAGKCTGSKLFYKPGDNCRAYNKCVIGRNPLPSMCSREEKFDGWQHKCVPFTC